MAQQAVAKGYGKSEYLRAHPKALSSRVKTTDSAKSLSGPDLESIMLLSFDIRHLIYTLLRRATRIRFTGTRKLLPKESLLAGLHVVILKFDHINGLRTLFSLGYFKLNRLSFVESFETVTFNSGVMNEDVSPSLLLNKAVTF